MKLKKADAAQILGVEVDADDEEVKRCFKLLALKWHPDKNNNSVESTERFKEINAAYQRMQDRDDDDLHEVFFDDDDFEVPLYEDFMDFLRFMFHAKAGLNQGRGGFAFGGGFPGGFPPRSFSPTSRFSGAYARTYRSDYYSDSDDSEDEWVTDEGSDEDDEEEVEYFRRRQEQRQEEEKRRCEEEKKRREEDKLRREVAEERRKVEEAAERKRRAEEESKKKAELKARHEAEEAAKRSKKEAKARQRERQLAGDFGKHEERPSPDKQAMEATPAPSVVPESKPSPDKQAKKAVVTETKQEPVVHKDEKDKGLVQEEATSAKKKKKSSKKEKVEVTEERDERFAVPDASTSNPFDVLEQQSAPVKAKPEPKKPAKKRKPVEEKRTSLASEGEGIPKASVRPVVVDSKEDLAAIAAAALAVKREAEEEARERRRLDELSEKLAQELQAEEDRLAAEQAAAERRRRQAPQPPAFISPSNTAQRTRPHPPAPQVTRHAAPARDVTIPPKQAPSATRPQVVEEFDPSVLEEIDPEVRAALEREAAGRRLDEERERKAVEQRQRQEEVRKQEEERRRRAEEVLLEKGKAGGGPKGKSSARRRRKGGAKTGGEEAQGVETDRPIEEVRLEESEQWASEQTGWYPQEVQYVSPEGVQYEEGAAREQEVAQERLQEVASNYEPWSIPNILAEFASLAEKKQERASPTSPLTVSSQLSDTLSDDGAVHESLLSNLRLSACSNSHPPTAHKAAPYAPPVARQAAKPYAPGLPSALFPKEHLKQEVMPEMNLLDYILNKGSRQASLGSETRQQPELGPSISQTPYGQVSSSDQARVSQGGVPYFLQVGGLPVEQAYASSWVHQGYTSPGPAPLDPAIIDFQPAAPSLHTYRVQEVLPPVQKGYGSPHVNGQLERRQNGASPFSMHSPEAPKLNSLRPYEESYNPVVAPPKAEPRHSPLYHNNVQVSSSPYQMVPEQYPYIQYINQQGGVQVAHGYQGKQYSSQEVQNSEGKKGDVYKPREEAWTPSPEQVAAAAQKYAGQFLPQHLQQPRSQAYFSPEHFIQEWQANPEKQQADTHNNLPHQEDSQIDPPIDPPFDPPIDPPSTSYGSAQVWRRESDEEAAGEETSAGGQEEEHHKLPQSWQYPEETLEVLDRYVAHEEPLEGFPSSTQYAPQAEPLGVSPQYFSQGAPLENPLQYLSQRSSLQYGFQEEPLEVPPQYAYPAEPLKSSPQYVPQVGTSQYAPQGEPLEVSALNISQGEPLEVSPPFVSQGERLKGSSRWLGSQDWRAENPSSSWQGVQEVGTPGGWQGLPGLGSESGGSGSPEVGAPYAQAQIHKSPPAVSRPPLRSSKPCRYFLQGLCKRGDRCHHSHELPGEAGTPLQQRYPQQKGRPSPQAPISGPPSHKHVLRPQHHNQGGHHRNQESSPFQRSASTGEGVIRDRGYASQGSQRAPPHWVPRRSANAVHGASG